jgi:hypothetical protein
MATFGSYDLMLANPPEYDGPMCPSCGEPQDHEMWCDRCEDNAVAMGYTDVAELVRVARSIAASGYCSRELTDVLSRFPEPGAR